MSETCWCDTSKAYWCIKRPEGFLVPSTMRTERDEAIDDFLKASQHFNFNDWESFKTVGFSVVEVELNEKGKHCDTIILEKFEQWIAVAEDKDMKEFFTDDIGHEKSIHQAINEVTREEK